jgi:hypothetical protein
MKIHAYVAFGFWLLVYGCTLEKDASEKRPTKKEKKAIAAIEEVHGQIERDEKRPGGPVIKVDLTVRDIDDGFLVKLQALPDLSELILTSP